MAKLAPKVLFEKCWTTHEHLFLSFDQAWNKKHNDQWTLPYYLPSYNIKKLALHDISIFMYTENRFFKKIRLFRNSSLPKHNNWPYLLLAVRAIERNNDNCRHVYYQAEEGDQVGRQPRRVQLHQPVPEPRHEKLRQDWAVDSTEI